jgi:hypothetical protein
MEKMHATTSERDPQMTIEEIDMEVKGDGPKITTTTAPIAKSPQDTKTTAIKEVIAEARDIKAMEKRTIKSFPQENPSAEDMLNGPCHIHSAFVNGKGVSRHAMKDCTTFLKLQEVALNKQTEARRQGFEGSNNPLAK